MGIFGLFRRKPTVGDIVALGDFIDQNAAFLVQKGIYEYSRARAGHYAKVLFGEPEFAAACDESRWRAYPLGLAMLAELVDAVLDSAHPDGRAGRLAAIRALTLGVFDRYPVPAPLDAQAWRVLRADLERRLALIGLHPPKPAMDIPRAFAKDYFALMPIHEKLRGRDAPTMHNYLRVTMCNMHDELSRRIDVKAVLDQLGASAQVADAAEGR